MNKLPSGCSYSEFNVYPSNWNTTRASIKKDWRIEYYFRDPAFIDRYPNGKATVVKGGINRVRSLEERQDLVRELLEMLRDLLENQGYNPITKTKLVVPDPEPILPPAPEPTHYPADDRTLSTHKYLESLKGLVPDVDTPLIPALWLGLKRKVYAPKAVNDIGSIIRGVEDAARTLQLDRLKISELKRRHLVLILEKCAELNPKWSDNRRNMYKAYLSGIIKPLLTLECLENNPTVGIDKVDVVRPPREKPTWEERKRIRDHLKDRDYRFWRFVQMFFHSGARETELIEVKDTDVDLENQTVWVTVRKRKGAPVRTRKPIKTIALPLWREVLQECNAVRAKHPGAPVNLFARLLKPGILSDRSTIRPDQVGRRWKKYVKEELGIDKDLYSLKHLNTEELMDALSQETSIEQAEKEVAEIMSHTSEKMLQQVYDQKNGARKNQRAAAVNNPFC